MSYKFMAEDFYDAINSLNALGTFPHDLGDYFIRNSDKYKEACAHLHKDMLEQTPVVIDMDTLQVEKEIHPFKLPHDEILIALQADKVDKKRMLSITRYQPEGGGNDEMIIVPIVAGKLKHQWGPVGIVLFLRELDSAADMQIRTQEFPGAIAGSDKQNKLMAIILDAVNMIVAAMAKGTLTAELKEPSAMKVERAKLKNKDIVLNPFTLMSVK